MLIQNHALIDSSCPHFNDPDSNRFLAHLLLVLYNQLMNFLMLKIQPCGKLDTEAKSHLISASLSKISPIFLEDASIFLGEKNGEESICTDFPVPSHQKAVLHSLDTELNDMAIVGFDAMQRANSTLEDFVGNRSCVLSSMESFKTDPFRPLVLLLERLGLLTERIKEEFKCGEQYWTMERKLCSALTNRLKVNELHMEFLSVSEVLAEVSDDLFDYEDDVLENSFNVLRMFVRVHGSVRAPAMLAKFISETEEKYNCLLKALDPLLSVKYQRRCEEATSEGGEKSSSPLGSWSIPTIIKDEDLYRFEHLRPTTATDSFPNS